MWSSTGRGLPSPPGPPGAGPPTSHLRAPDQRAVVEARDHADALLTTPGRLGVLDRAVDRIVAAGAPGSGRGTLVLAAGRHAVTAYAVSAYADTVTDDVLAASHAGTAMAAVAARETERAR
jgi:nicotinate-nucleotide--dimethylbenzimidazole phosphoribosyltransferase